MATSTPVRKKKPKYDDVPWQSTACILCGLNCGIEVKVKDRHFVKVRGDKSHPLSEGYLCQKAARIDYYQNHLHGRYALCQSHSGQIEVKVTFDKAQRRGFVSLPHGYGLEYPDLQSEEMVQHGPRLNLITSSDHCDPIAKTPYHKYVPVRLRPVAIAAD